EGDGTGMGHDDVEVRRFGDDREVARHAGPDRRERALASVLLAGDERHDELAADRIRRAARDERPDGADDRGDAALHVARAAPVEPAVADLAGPRIDRPRRRVAGGHDVDMAGQDDAPSAPASQATDDAGQGPPGRLLTGPP